MFVVSRFDVPEAEQEGFRARAAAALGALATRPGYRSGRVGRSLDDPTLWTVTTAWTNVGSYRRALSAYDVKLHASPLLALARDEPSSFETLVYDDGILAETAASDRAEGAATDGPGTH